MKAKLINVQDKGPVAKTRSGKFQVSTWHWKKVIPPRDDLKDLFPEREFDVRRACIRHSQRNRNTGTWDEQVIWCSLEDLRSLVQALDEFDED